MTAPHLSLPSERVAEICRRYQIQKLSLFGSAARDDFRADSDVDFMVEFEPGAAPSLFGLADLQEELSVLAGHRKVDIATSSILENPFRRKTILRDIKAIYAAP